MERSGNFYKAIRLGYILISILIGCMAYNSLYEWQEIEALELGNKKIDELGYRARIHWPSFYNVVTGKTLALPNLIALQHIPLSPAGVIAKRPAPIALPNSCAA